MNSIITLRIEMYTYDDNWQQILGYKVMKPWWEFTEETLSPINGYLFSVGFIDIKTNEHCWRIER